LDLRGSLVYLLLSLQKKKKLFKKKKLSKSRWESTGKLVGRLGPPWSLWFSSLYAFLTLENEQTTLEFCITEKKEQKKKWGWGWDYIQR
jgi:hypothetical protein